MHEATQVKPYTFPQEQRVLQSDLHAHRTIISKGSGAGSWSVVIGTSLLCSFLLHTHEVGSLSASLVFFARASPRDTRHGSALLYLLEARELAQ